MKSIMKITMLFVLLASAAFSYEVKEYSPQVFLKWSTAAPVALTLYAAGSADVPVASVQTAVQQALGSWQAVPGQGLILQFAGVSSTAVANSTDLVNSIVWYESAWPYPPEMIAVTRTSYYLQPAVVYADADILMNGQTYKWSVSNTTNSPQVSIRQVLTHEIGHLLGMAHTAVYGAAMYPSLSGNVNNALQMDDKVGMQFLYGSVGTGFAIQTPIPNAVYVGNMAQSGLPLPVLRWRAIPGASYTIEFADTASFNKKYVVSAGAKNSLALTFQHEAKLISLAPDKQIFWRVVAGSQRTQARQLRFR